AAVFGGIDEGVSRDHHGRMNDNPLLKRWDTPYALPPFNEIEAAQFKPAFEEAMREHTREIEQIASSSEPPTFENTVASLDRAGEAFSRVAHTFFNLAASETCDALQEAEREIAPRVAAHENAVNLHEGLFSRVRAVYDSQADDSTLRSGEDRRLLERVYRRFVRNGALLTGQSRRRYAEITEELASLYTSFSQAVLADEAAFTLELPTEEERAGLPEFVLDAAAAVARDKGIDGYAINLSPSLVDPFLTYSTRRDLREKVWNAYKARGETGTERDTRPIAARIVALRSELAGLLGYNTFAEYALADRMAATPDAVSDLLEQVWEPAKRRAAEEQQELQTAAHADGLSGEIRGWDWHFYAEKVRRSRFDLDEAALKSYFEFDRMVDAMFECANRLYGLRFSRVDGVPIYHADARLFEVRRGADGELVGVLIVDPFARSSKRGGAWMSMYRSQARNRLEGPGFPVVVINTNFAKATEGRPTLLSYDNVRTLFHEFGHALHGLLSNVTYAELSGTNVRRDFVELPSQLHENWALDPSVLKKHAVHTGTGEPITDELVEKIRRAETFNQGFRTVEYTACALVDMALHSKDRGENIDLDKFEQEQTVSLGIPEAIGLRHRLPHFRHLFSDDGYAAGYYVYMWAEVLEADAFEAFQESGDVFNPELAERFRRCVLEVGDSVDPTDAYRCFRSRDAQVHSMLKKRGLISA
ncbi:MAG: M3 family metallopeptidase, partial [Spirochaetales bacterium]